MAEKNLLVRLKLEGADQMAAGHKKVADAATQQAKATKSLADADREYQQSRQRVRNALQDANNMRPTVDRAAPRFDPRDEAMRRLNKADMDRRVQEEMRRLGHGPTNSGALAGSMRMIAPLLGAEALSRGFERFGAGLNTVAASETSFTNIPAALDQAMQSFAEGLPVIGGFVKGLRQAGDALSGYTQTIADANRFGADADRRNAMQGAISAVERRGRAEMFRIASGAEDAAISARAAREFQNSLTPDELARLTPTTGEGGSSAALIAQRQAQLGVATSDALLAQRRRELGANLSSGWNPEELQSELARRQSRVDALTRADADVARRQSLSSNPRMFEPERAQLQNNAKAELGSLANIRSARSDDLAELRARIENVAKAELDAANRRLELSKATLAVEQDRLNHQKSQLESAKSLAGKIGTAQPGELEEARRIIEAIRAGGINAVSPEERQFAGRFTTEVDRAAMLAGQQDPNFGFFNESNRIGQQPIGQGVLGGMEQQVREMEQRIIAESAKAFTLATEATERAKRIEAEQLGKIIAQAVRLDTNAIENATRKELTNGQIQARANS